MDNQEQYRDSSLPVSEDSRPTRLPPIRILDLIVLTSAMAFIFMVQDKMTTFEPEFFQSTSWLIIRMVSAVPAGIAVASIFWIVNQKRITGRLFLQPGHWVLASYALIITLSFGLWFLLLKDLDFNLPGSTNRYCVSLGLTNVAASALIILAFFSNPARWRVVIATLAISFASTGMTYIASLTNTRLTVGWMKLLGYGLFAADAICIVALIIAVVVDIKKRTSRDWLHWAGTLVLFLFLAFDVEPIVSMIVKRFL